DFSFDGVPMAFARGGTPPGYILVEFDGSDFTVDFRAAGQPVDRKLALSFNTPAFRDWFTTLFEWQDEVGSDMAEVPPATLHDLPDVKLFTPEELSEGVFLTANFWPGERNSTVVARINGGMAMEMTRTQDGEGEDIRAGAEWADPFAVQRQMTVGRFAFQSQVGAERAQGFEIWQGVEFGPGAPRPQNTWMLADSSTHLWRLELPADLPVGAHVIEVTAMDQHGREFTDRIVFEVRAERPFPYWDNTLWDDS
ncbi:MAG: calcineurin-like phosphoesterase C-terminal domain-containing protein, partial [Pseudomonadota bacterium]